MSALRDPACAGLPAFCPSCGTPVPRDKELPDAPCEPVGPNQGDAAYTPESNAASVPGTPSSPTGDDGQKNSDIPVSSSPGPWMEKPGEFQQSPHTKRSAVTVIPGPDEKERPVFSRVPVLAIASHKYLILILIAIIVLAGIAVLEGKLRLPSLDSSAGPVDSAGSAAEGTGSAQEQVATTPAIITQAVNFTPGPTRCPSGQPPGLLSRRNVTPQAGLSLSGLWEGKVRQAVQDVFVRLTRSDGQVITGSSGPCRLAAALNSRAPERWIVLK